MIMQRLSLRSPGTVTRRSVASPSRASPLPGRRVPPQIRFQPDDAPAATAADKKTEIPPPNADIPVPLIPEPAATGMPLVETVDIPPRQDGAVVTDPGAVSSSGAPGATKGTTATGAQQPASVAVDLPSGAIPPQSSLIPTPGSVKPPVVLGTASQVVGAGLLALSIVFVALPNIALPFLFPSASGQPQSWFLSAVWGATLLPLAAAVLNINGIVESAMAGTQAADQLLSSVMLGSAAILLVIIQAISLRHTPLNVIGGGLAGAGLAVTGWLLAVAHPWMLPLPKISTLVSSFLSVFRSLPTHWSSWIWAIISLGQIGAGIWLSRSSSADMAPLLLGRLTAPTHGVQALSIFVERAGGAALVASGLLSGLLSGAAEKQLMASKVARRISSAIGTSSLIIPLAIGMAFAVGAVAPSVELRTLFLGQLAVATWAVVAYFRPVDLGRHSVVVVGPGGQQTPVPTPKWLNTAPGLMSSGQFWQAMAVPRETY